MAKPKKIEYSEALARRICEAISIAPKSVAEVCRENDDFPPAQTVYRWVLNNKEFADMLSCAKRAQIEPLIDRIFELLRLSHENEIIRDVDGKIILNHIHIHKIRLEIDTIKWLASKLVPKVYGVTKVEKAEEEDAISQFRMTD